MVGDAADGGVEGVGGSTVELLLDDGERVFAGVVRDSEEFCGLGGTATDTDLREAGRCGAAQQLSFDVGDVGEVFGVPFRQQMLWDVLDAEPNRLRTRGSWSAADAEFRHHVAVSDLQAERSAQAGRAVSTVGQELPGPEGRAVRCRDHERA